MLEKLTNQTFADGVNSDKSALILAGQFGAESYQQRNIAEGMIFDMRMRYHHFLYFFSRHRER